MRLHLKQKKPSFKDQKASVPVSVPWPKFWSWPKSVWSRPKFWSWPESFWSWNWDWKFYAKLLWGELQLLDENLTPTRWTLHPFEVNFTPSSWTSPLWSELHPFQVTLDSSHSLNTVGTLLSRHCVHHGYRYDTLVNDPGSFGKFTKDLVDLPNIW